MFEKFEKKLTKTQKIAILMSEVRQLLENKDDMLHCLDALGTTSFVDGVTCRPVLEVQRNCGKLGPMRVRIGLRGA